MRFSNEIHTLNQVFARAVSEAIDRTDAGPKKEKARQHLCAANRAKQAGNEVNWILEVDRAFKALNGNPPIFNGVQP